MIEEIIARAPRTWAFKVPSERLQKLTRFSELGELLAFRTGEQPSYSYDEVQWESWDELSAHVRPKTPKQYSTLSRPFVAR